MLTLTRPRRRPTMTTDAPLVSVIIPAYNAETTIGAAITGALTQTHPNVEVVVVDDGSTDRTRQICESFGDLITFRSIENRGTAGARNEALSLAQGAFVALADADDMLLPPHVAAALQVWEAAGAGRRFVHCEALLMTAGGIAHGRKVTPVKTPPVERQRLEILEANFVSGITVAPTDMYRELGGFSDRYLEDWDMWMRAIFAGWEAVAQPVPHALYRTGWTSKSTDKRAVYDAEDAMLRDLLTDETVDLRPEEKDYLSKRLSNSSPRALLTQAEDALREGRDDDARRLFGEASSLWPSNRKIRIKVAALRGPGVARLWRRRMSGVEARLGRPTS